MKMEEIKQLSDADLLERLGEARTELSNLRFNHTLAGLENPNVMKAKRRDVARLLTEYNSRNKKA
jgi:large subunit ribosomal protein L29